MSRASRSTVVLRTEAMIQLILDGKKQWHIRPLIAEGATDPESPWHTKDGLPVAPRTIRRYQWIAKRRIAESAAETRQDALERHVSQRLGLYERAMRQGDTRTALAILDSLARLQGLTPEGELAEQVRLAREENERLRQAMYGGRLGEGNGDGAALPLPGGATHGPVGSNGNGASHGGSNGAAGGNGHAPGGGNGDGHGGAEPL